jgi:hypothetical protein
MVKFWLIEAVPKPLGALEQGFSQGELKLTREKTKEYT